MRRNATLFVAISLLSGFGSTAMALVAGIWVLDLTGSSSVAGSGSASTRRCWPARGSARWSIGSRASRC